MILVMHIFVVTLENHINFEFQIRSDRKQLRNCLKIKFVTLNTYYDKIFDATLWVKNRPHLNTATNYS